MLFFKMCPREAELQNSQVTIAAVTPLRAHIRLHQVSAHTQLATWDQTIITCQITQVREGMPSPHSAETIEILTPLPMPYKHQQKMDLGTKKLLSGSQEQKPNIGTATYQTETHLLMSVG